MEIVNRNGPEGNRLRHPVRHACLAMLATVLSLSVAHGDNCPSVLDDESRADVVSNPSGYDYDVYYTTDSGSDQFSAASAGDVRDSLGNSHNTLTDATRNFAPPGFSDDPQDTCISNSANIATAPEWGFTVDAPQMNGQPEPFIRAVMAHEMFHHAEYAYIDFNDWPSWGAWNVEGAARAMEDKMWTDNDQTPMNTLYIGEINNYLGNPNRTLWNISYTSALAWTYWAEQLGTPFPEPSRGVDFIQRFWSFTAGRSPDGIGVLRDTIASFTSRTLEEMFIDFAITNYTHDLDVNGLAEPDRWRYFDESAAGGGTPYNAVARTQVNSFNTPLSDSVVRWGARYFEVEVPKEQDCEAIGFWGKAQNGKTLGWALVGQKPGGEVTEIYSSTGNEFYRALINFPGDGYDKLGLVVIGLDDSADFDYAFGFGAVTGEIRRPTLDRMAFVGEKNDPERFQVRLLMQGPGVLTPSGSGDVSLRGLDTTLFDVSLRSNSTGAVYPASIVNASYVSGEYWMIVQAPEITNPADGDLYTLEICFCERSGSCSKQLVSSKSVLYADITLNQMLVIDTSGSMDHPGADPKIAAARNAASLYVDALDDDDRIGVVQFNGNDSECDNDATVEHPLSDVATDRELARNAAQALGAGGWTSIGDGIKEGRDQLFGAASLADINGMVLMSDGLENEGDFWSNSNGACGSPPVKNSFDPSIGGAAAEQRIDTIAFGADADQALLQSIASFTGGDFYAVSTDAPIRHAQRSVRAPSLSPSVLEVPNRLANAYRSAEEQSAGLDRLFTQADTFSGGLAVAIEVSEAAGGGVIDGVFSFNWNDGGAGIAVKLFDPNGNPVSASDPDWLVTQDKTNIVFRYAGKLQLGTWVAEATGSGSAQLLSMLSGRVVRGVDMEVYFSQVPGALPQPECKRDAVYTYLRGLPVTIAANLSDSKGGLQAVAAEALIENPDGSTNRLRLFDDGQHDDGLSGDGIYANRYTKTPFYSTGGVPDFPLGPPSGLWGSYNVQITASGESHWGEKFARNATRSFQVYEFDPQHSECNPDTDHDGLPDRWEDLYGLDSSDPLDVLLDNDNDGLANDGEFKTGGLPLDPDTDDGGESDGSEVNGGRDLVYTPDDLLPAIVDYGLVTQRTDLPVHEPVPETLILHFPVHPSYRLMHIYRTDPGWTGFKRIDSVDLGSDPRGVYYDRPLTPGVHYDYYLQAEGSSGALTAPTDAFGYVAQTDSLPPKGWIKLNDGLAQSTSFTLLVDVDTSDDSIQMKISEDPTFAGENWKTLSTGFTLALPPRPTPVPVTVYAKFRDGEKNESIVYHDTILVDPNADNDGDGIIDAADNCTLVANPAQVDSNGDGYGNHCDADLSNDGVVNTVDLGMLKAVFFTADPDADFDVSGSVSFADLAIMKEMYFGPPGPAGPVP